MTERPMDRNSAEIWEVIRAVVETGREDDVVDLKSEWYDLSSRLGKAEFLKDICAMANPLRKPYDAKWGYIVCGVLDAKHRAECTNAADYVKGVQPSPVNELNERIGQLVDEYIDPYIEVRYVELEHPDVHAILGVLEIRGCWDDRPYILKNSIHDLSKGQIYVRLSAGISRLAKQGDIRRLVAHSQEWRIEHLEQEKKELEDRYREELENIEMQIEQEYQARITKLEQEKTEIEEDYQRIRAELQDDKDKLVKERERFKELARGLSRRFWQCSEADRSILCTCFRRYGMEDWLIAWCSSD